MKLSQLNKQKLTEKDIEGTEEYRKLIKSNGASHVLAGCILHLRGDFATPELGIAQAKVQMQVAHTGWREMVSQKTAIMNWQPSGNILSPATNNNFVKLILGDGKVDIYNGSATMNCWEAVIVAAMLDRALKNPARLKWIYESSAQKFTAELVHALTGNQHAYLPQSLLGRPVKGDVVLFSGLDHVALATGTQGIGVANPPFYPGDEVINFWPAPRQDKFGPGTKTKVELFSIQAIDKWVQKNMNQQMKVSFGCPDWLKLNQ